MGSKYEITAWMRAADRGYHDVTMWTGRNLFVALYKLWQIKRQGHGCVSLHVR